MSPLCPLAPPPGHLLLPPSPSRSICAHANCPGGPHANCPGGPHCHSVPRGSPPFPHATYVEAEEVLGSGVEQRDLPAGLLLDVGAAQAVTGAAGAGHQQRPAGHRPPLQQEQGDEGHNACAGREAGVTVGTKPSMPPPMAWAGRSAGHHPRTRPAPAAQGEGVQPEWGPIPLGWGSGLACGPPDPALCRPGRAEAPIPLLSPSPAPRQALPRLPSRRGAPQHSHISQPAR